MFPRSSFIFKLRFLFLAIVIVCFMDYFGAFTHMFELDYYRLFNYPLEGDIQEYAYRVRFHQPLEVKPINVYNYTFFDKRRHKCLDEANSPITPKITFIVKSAMENFERRLNIRLAWGYELRYTDVIIRTVFMLGSSTNPELQKHVRIEGERYNDIVQSDFIDTYYNNTIKTMMGMKWAVETCPTSKYYFFVDDDYFVSTRNAIRFVDNAETYPRELVQAEETLRKLGRRMSKDAYFYKFTGPRVGERAILNHDNRFYEDIDGSYVMKPRIDPNDKLYAGFVLQTTPHRHKPSKWYVSLEEYPFHKWPPYVTAGAFILSREALFDMYYASMFVKHFRFDDIYLGLVALKAKIPLRHCEEFYFQRPTYSGPYSYRYVVAAHGFGDALEMMKIYNECKAAGHA